MDIQIEMKYYLILKWYRETLLLCIFKRFDVVSDYSQMN